MKRMIVWCLLAMVAGAGCAGGLAGKARYPNAVTPEAQGRFDAADSLYRSKRFAEADAAFAKLIAELPYTQLTDEARFRRGEIAFAYKNYNAALGFYRGSYSQIESPAVAPKARFKAALCLFRLNHAQETLSELEAISRRDASVVLRLRTDSLGVRASKAAGLSPNISIVWQLRLLDNYPESQGVRPSGIGPDELVSEDAALSEVKRWVGDKTVTAAEVEALPTKEMRGHRSGGFASYKLALILHSTGDTKEAIKQLKIFVSTYPKHEYYGAARVLMGELGGVIGEGAGTSIGALLPLSGKYAIYGESALHGVECAIGVFEPCVGPGGIKIVVRDSGSTPAEAVAAVNELAAANVVGIVGPLLSTNALEAAARAQELRIPIISLSQRGGVAETGEYIFRNSVSDSSEMSMLADYAVNRMHLKRFYILYPSSSKKAIEYKGLFSEAIRAQGGSVVDVKGYSEGQMVEVSDELRGRGRAEFQQQKQKKNREEGGKSIDITPTTANYDAVFIPDSLSMASYIAQRLESSKAKVLGISRWGDHQHEGHIDSSLNGAVFVNSFYMDAPEEHVSNFVSRFREAYGSEPTLLEALGYDSARMISTAVLEKGAAGRDALRAAIARTSGFPGVAGKTTVTADRNAERQLRVLTFKDGSIRPSN
ncbi:MAG: penicillin-binding protein activator [Pseudomonadota bacterium]